MFLFSLCLGRRPKSSARQEEPDPIDQKIPTYHAAEMPTSNSDDSDSIKMTCEIEPQKMHNFEYPMGTPTSMKSTAKKVYTSSIISRSSATFSQFRPTSATGEQTADDSQLSVDLTWPKSNMSSNGLNLHMKNTESNFERRLATHDESDEPPLVRPNRYSDDPFAPPTPRMAAFSNSFCRHSAESDTTGSFVVTPGVEKIDHDMNEDSTILMPPSGPHLPTITRISKLSIDWILQLENSPVLHRERPPFSSMSRSTTPASPETSDRTPTAATFMNTPRTINSLSCFSTKTDDTNELPFTEYP